MSDLLDVTLLVTRALDHCSIPYSVGGSLASSFSGEPRASIDVDILVDMTAEQVPCLVDALAEEFYLDGDALRSAVAARSNTNAIHRPTSVKVDLFLPNSILDARQLERRRRVHVGPDERYAFYVHSPEDILLQKLHWYRLGGEISDRQWRDVMSVIVVQGPRLDRVYLRAAAGAAGLTDLLQRALAAASP